jgi:hypothetical protein
LLHLGVGIWVGLVPGTPAIDSCHKSFRDVDALVSVVRSGSVVASTGHPVTYYHSLFDARRYQCLCGSYLIDSLVLSSC